MGMQCRGWRRMQLVQRHMQRMIQLVRLRHGWLCGRCMRMRRERLQGLLVWFLHSLWLQRGRRRWRQSGKRIGIIIKPARKQVYVLCTTYHWFVHFEFILGLVDSVELSWFVCSWRLTDDYPLISPFIYTNAGAIKLRCVSHNFNLINNIQFIIHKYEKLQH